MYFFCLLKCGWIEFQKATKCYSIHFSFHDVFLHYSINKINLLTLLTDTIKKSNIACFSDYKGIRTHNHLVCKRTLNHLAKQADWLNCWVLVHELIGWRFESCCSHLNFRYRDCFEQKVSWHSGNCSVYSFWRCNWHDKNNQ